MIGPAAIAAAATAAPLARGRTRPGGPNRRPDLASLGPRLRRASGAVGQIRGGLGEASAAGGLLGEGAARAGEGSELLAAGLDRGERGRRRGPPAPSTASRQAPSELAKGQEIASGTAYGLSLGLGTLLPNLTAQSLGRAHRLAGSLRRAAAEDPSLAPAAHEAEVLASALSANREELARLRAPGPAL